MTVRLDHIVRLNNSISGNPRFRVYFEDGSSAVTQTDGAVNYEVENIANDKFAYDVEVTYSKSGRIVDMVVA